MLFLPGAQDGQFCGPAPPSRRRPRGVCTMAHAVRPDHRGTKVSERRHGNTLFTHVANQLGPGIRGPVSSPEAHNLPTQTPVP